MKLFKLISATCIVGFATISAINPAHAASDWKVFSGGSCVPFGTTTAADLTVSGLGVTNKSTTASKSVLCPLVYDGEGKITAEAPTTVVVYYGSGAASGNVYCSVYVGGPQTGQVSATLNGTWIAPNTNLEVYAEITTGPAGNRVGYPMNLVCTLTARTSLRHIYVRELIATNQ